MTLEHCWPSSPRLSPESIPPPAHVFLPTAAVFKELWRGRSLCRAYMNLWLLNFTARGRTIDLGAKTANASYWEYLRRSADCQVMPTDLHAAEGVLSVDVEKSLPFMDASIDTIVALNLFEHVQNPSSAPGEFCRVLKTGGQAIIFTPFFVGYHGDPYDFYRYTDKGLALMFAADKTRISTLAVVGEGVVTMATELVIRSLVPSLIAARVFALCYPVLTFVDRVFSKKAKIAGRSLSQRYPLGILLVVERS